MIEYLGISKPKKYANKAGMDNTIKVALLHNTT